ncbi:hypothetical protein [Streptomyces chartreusis]|uniref:hypothetical protein n=1 Tax=Streptomyces chartreusis TaxID=1969 RepID=UPI0036B98D15
MEPPVAAALIASFVAIGTNAVGWGLTISQNKRQTRNEHRHWQRGTRRDAYAELVTTLQQMHNLFAHHRRVTDEVEHDEGLTPQMEESLEDLYLKAVIVRMEGPKTMRDLAEQAVACGDEMAHGWQKVNFRSEQDHDLDDALKKTQETVDALIDVAEGIVGID